jgi:hypothetical protein
VFSTGIYWRIDVEEPRRKDVHDWINGVGNEVIRPNAFHAIPNSRDADAPLALAERRSLDPARFTLKVD